MKQIVHKQKGASILEFLVIVPFLFTLSITAIEFGTIFTRLNTLTKSVQDATRFLSDSPANMPDAQTIATNLIKYGTVGTGTQILPGVTKVSPTNPDANHVQISVVYNHTPIAGQALSQLLQWLGGSKGIDLSIPLNASSVMRYTR
jgi:Flp pilus assembly protein TadG